MQKPFDSDRRIVVLTGAGNVEPDPADARPFHEQHIGRAEDLLPVLFG